MNILDYFHISVGNPKDDESYIEINLNDPTVNPEAVIIDLLEINDIDIESIATKYYAQALEQLKGALKAAKKVHNFLNVWISK